MVEAIQRIPEHVEPVAPTVAQHLAPLLESDLAVIYRPTRTETSWQLDLFAAAGATQDHFQTATAAFLARAPANFAIYDAARPRPQDRNRVLLIDPRRAPPGYHRSAIVRELMTDLDLARQCQSRVIICDGPEMLAWVGGFRKRPFRLEGAEVLRVLTNPLRARLKLERQLAVGERDRRALVAALDAIDAAAFLLVGQRIEYANEAGRTRLDLEKASTREDFDRVAKHSGSRSFDVTGPGLPPLRLVVLRPSGGNTEGRLREVMGEWKLSPRQGDVLRLLADGEPNKGIAAKLGCAEVTVEFHLTGLLRKSGTQNRSELIARFWNRC